METGNYNAGIDEAFCSLENHTDPTAEEPGCTMTFDSILCWPKTLPATWATQPCPERFEDIIYDHSQNATRFCHLDGTWDNYTNFDECTHFDVHQEIIPDNEHHVIMTTSLYIAGYTISLIALTIAVIVFVRLKDLRCLRNKIHLNLFFTYILTAITWILILMKETLILHDAFDCKYLVVVLHYCTLTNFFWMLIEGMYLHTLVVQTFSGNIPKLKVYVLIGWGCPFFFVTLWTITKCLVPMDDDSDFMSEKISCTWLKDSPIDWINHIPTLSVLLINLLLLCRIMWVLITKLRSAVNGEVKQYRKASKALLVLIPLFGITYIILLYGPEYGLASYIFGAIRVSLLSLQGLMVAMFYCFLNSGVRAAVRHRWNLWRDSRNLQQGHLEPPKRDPFGVESGTSELQISTHIRKKR